MSDAPTIERTTDVLRELFLALTRPDAFELESTPRGPKLRKNPRIESALIAARDVLRGVAVSTVEAELAALRDSHDERRGRAIAADQGYGRSFEERATELERQLSHLAHLYAERKRAMDEFEAATRSLLGGRHASRAAREAHETFEQALAALPSPEVYQRAERAAHRRGARWALLVTALLPPRLVAKEAERICTMRERYESEEAKR